MEQTPHDAFNAKFTELIEAVPTIGLDQEDSTAIIKNLKTFSECRPPQPEPEPTPDPVPTTRWGKAKAGLASALDNETTRTLIKAGGAFAGVAVVAYSTIHKDHVLERQAIAQANQQPR